MLDRNRNAPVRAAGIRAAGKHATPASAARMEATNKAGMQQAVDYFSFSRGLLKLKDLTAQLQNVRYTGVNLIRADKLLSKVYATELSSLYKW